MQSTESTSVLPVLHSYRLGALAARVPLWVAPLAHTHYTVQHLLQDATTIAAAANSSWQLGILCEPRPFMPFHCEIVGARSGGPPCVHLWQGHPLDQLRVYRGLQLSLAPPPSDLASVGAAVTLHQLASGSIAPPSVPTLDIALLWYERSAVRVSPVLLRRALSTFDLPDTFALSPSSFATLPCGSVRSPLAIALSVLVPALLRVMVASVPCCGAYPRANDSDDADLVLGLVGRTWRDNTGTVSATTELCCPGSLLTAALAHGHVGARTVCSVLCDRWLPPLPPSSKQRPICDADTCFARSIRRRRQTVQRQPSLASVARSCDTLTDSEVCSKFTLSPHCLYIYIIFAALHDMYHTSNNGILHGNMNCHFNRVVQCHIMMVLGRYSAPLD